MHPLIFCYSFSLGDDGTSRPTLPQLLRLKVPQGVGAHYTTFGVLLLNDETGSRVEALKMECLGVPGNITQKILQEWLEGKGLEPVTWETLIQTLRDSELSSLADHIGDDVPQNSTKSARRDTRKRCSLF